LRQRPPKEAKAGDPIEAKEWNTMRVLLARNSVTGVGKGVSIRRGIDGTTISVDAVQRYVAKTTSTISASNGTTAGSGTVEFYTLDISTATLFDTGCTDTVYLWSTAVGGIPSGKWCWVEQDMAGAWWVISAEC
jgi:hypothetical protein